MTPIKKTFKQILLNPLVLNCGVHLLEVNMKPIAYIKTDFGTKFGVPRQSGLVPELRGEIRFLPEYSRKEAFRELEQFSHIWAIWEFSEAKREKWSPTVRPPRLGGNKRIGVFATRSPFRPNNIGLSCLRLDEIVFEDSIAVLKVSGIDMMNGTPVFDIKPYIPRADCIPEASEGYTAETKLHSLEIVFPKELKEKLPSGILPAIEGILRNDPRPSYIDNPERIYGVEFSGFDIKFSVNGNILTVMDICPLTRTET